MSCTKETIAVSMCFQKGNCKYDGGDNIADEVTAFLEEYNTITVCPEMFSGLGCPRKPCEILSSSDELKVINSSGDDLTAYFVQGAEKALRLAKMAGAKVALLKARSPSCGSGVIYDGTFSSKKVPGDGVCAKLFKENGIEVFSEFELDKLKEKIKENQQQ